MDTLLLLLIILVIIILNRKTISKFFNLDKMTPADIRPWDFGIKDNKLDYEQIREKYKILQIPLLNNYPENREIENVNYLYTHDLVESKMKPIIEEINKKDKREFVLNDIVYFKSYDNLMYIRVSIFEKEWQYTRILEAYFDNGVLEYASEYNNNYPINSVELFPEDEPETYNWFPSIEKWKVNYNNLEHQYQNQPLDFNPNVGKPNRVERTTGARPQLSEGVVNYPE
jgi:hypothetical protein